MSEMTRKQAVETINEYNIAFANQGVLPESVEEWETYRQAVEVVMDHMPEFGCFGIIPVENIDAPEWEKVKSVSGECPECAGHLIVHVVPGCICLPSC